HRTLAPRMAVDGDIRPDPIVETSHRRSDWSDRRSVRRCFAAIPREERAIPCGHEPTEAREGVACPVGRYNPGRRNGTYGVVPWPGLSALQAVGESAE